ncbi:MAG: macro domain-containing protein [Clostridia bacterium]|nr:macro domain-containing protein [Clostridia bacterium]
MGLYITREDITTMPVDAIVNAANCDLKNFAPRRGGGVCGAIFRAAGHAEMQAACDAIGHCETGQAVITKGFELPAKYVIHAVGPIYRPNDTQQALLLRNCYIHALDLAEENCLETVAFPLISSGIFGYPPKEALLIALKAIQDWLKENNGKVTVYLCLLDESLYSMAEDRLNEGQKPWEKEGDHGG